MANSVDPDETVSVLIIGIFIFHDQVKFHAQLNWAWEKFYNLGARLYWFGLPKKKWICKFERGIPHLKVYPYPLNTLLNSPGPKVIKLFSCSTQLSMNISLLINMKMPTEVGIFIFIST